MSHMNSTPNKPVPMFVCGQTLISHFSPQVSNLQKTLKASAASPSSGPAPAGAASNQDADQPAEPRDPASSQEPRQPGKKSSKVKGWVLWHHLCLNSEVRGHRQGGRQPDVFSMTKFLEHLGYYVFLYYFNRRVCIEIEFIFLQYGQTFYKLNT